MTRYRAAIIGTGRIGSLLERDPLRSKPHTHAGWYRQHPDIELVAGADTDRERLQQFGLDWAIPEAQLFTDYQVMLERVRPDLVSICAYAPQRLEMCAACIHAGARGLWIEKAIACSIEEAHGLMPKEYFKRFGLDPKKYPLTCKEYSAQRSKLAKDRGFGKEGGRKKATV